MPNLAWLLPFASLLCVIAGFVSYFAFSQFGGHWHEVFLRIVNGEEVLEYAHGNCTIEGHRVNKISSMDANDITDYRVIFNVTFISETVDTDHVVRTPGLAALASYTDVWVDAAERDLQIGMYPHGSTHECSSPDDPLPYGSVPIWSGAPEVIVLDLTEEEVEHLHRRFEDLFIASIVTFSLASLCCACGLYGVLRTLCRRRKEKRLARQLMVTYPSYAALPADDYLLADDYDDDEEDADEAVDTDASISTLSSNGSNMFFT